MENVDLDIRWADCGHNGQMQIHLKEFLTGDGRRITDLKKLLKIIRQSDTPDEEQKILNFVQNFLSDYNDARHNAEISKIGYERKVAFCQYQVEVLSDNRDKFKRNTLVYKYYDRI